LPAWSPLDISLDPSPTLGGILNTGSNDIINIKTTNTGDVKVSRSLGGNNQNTGSSPIIVIANLHVDGEATVLGYIGPTTSYGTTVIDTYFDTSVYSITYPAIMIVPPGWYYKLDVTGSVSKDCWNEAPIGK